MRALFRSRRARSESAPSSPPLPPRLPPIADPGSLGLPRPSSPPRSGVTDRPRPIPRRHDDQHVTNDLEDTMESIEPPAYMDPIPSYDQVIPPFSHSWSPVSPLTVNIQNQFDDDEDDDDPLTPRPRQFQFLSEPIRRHSLSTTIPQRIEEERISPSTIEEVDPLTSCPSALPVYSPHLHQDETRLFSTSHLDQTHPSALAFSHSLTSLNPPLNIPPPHPTISTGSKRLRVHLTRSAQRSNSNGTGPVLIKMGRGGVIEGKVEVGKGVEYGTKLEVIIVGTVQSTYHVRGQYSMMETLLLARNIVQLYPTMSPSPLSGQTQESSTQPTTETEVTVSGVGNDDQVRQESVTAQRDQVKKEQQFIEPGSTYDFSLTMPSSHYLDENVELPPSCHVLQLGMHASVEYVFRVRLSRKSWRMKETLSLPIIYEPHSYIHPRRLRILTSDDPLNPGWRTIPLRGGDPIRPSPSTSSSSTSNLGVQVSLLLPSPPIIFLHRQHESPPIPFHLHFHSSLSGPLEKLADPRQSRYIIRLVRVSSIRVGGGEREIRRTEIPTKVQLWKEGEAEEDRVELGSINAGVSGIRGWRRQSNVISERRRMFWSRIGTNRSSISNNVNPSTNNNSSQIHSTMTNDMGNTRITTGESGPSNISQIQQQLPTISTGINPESIDNNINQSRNINQSNGLSDVPETRTDIHLLGQIKIINSFPTPYSLYNLNTIPNPLLPSFVTPEIGVSYVVEIGIEPKDHPKVLNHVWGGGVMEVIRG
ncbi:hypothetical protein M231_00738 [Tremella mesenterica]|uniref:Uncharacterized protein n=1 Tax=Tremella mesenterica TaxID=5217 RepID=A0A4V1M4Y8_TREME|nr:hypothetical protein M231_00738 [Tremella mesenterica]